MGDLRSTWPTLSPRERDALVAKARGETFKPDREARLMAEWLKDYTASWAFAGRLLEEMLATGLYVELYPHGALACAEIEPRFASNVGSFGEGVEPFEADSYPSVIAIAYVAWKGVQP